MSEFRSSATRRDGRRRLFFATVFVLVVIALDMFSGGSLRATARSLTARVWSASAYVRGAVFGSGFFSSRASLASENATLRETLARYQEGAAGYQVLKQENDSLRSMLHLAQSERGITAPVVSSVIASPYGTFLVGAGTTDSVAVGSLVVTEGGFVVGTVSEAASRTSVVSELFAGGSSVNVLVGGAPAEAVGRGGGNARISLSRDVSVREGDPVTAPSLGGRAVGTVGKVVSDPSNASQTVYVILPVNLASLTYVYVIPRP
ncbi:MAG: rod shape-determining protein MreC [Patescibacteria group bacterium]